MPERKPKTKAEKHIHGYSNRENCADKKVKTVWYPGSGSDIFPLWIFKHANRFIYQDNVSGVRCASVGHPLYDMSERGLIKKLKVTEDKEKGRREYTFNLDNKKKTIIEYFHQHYGNPKLHIPEEVKTKVDAIYTAFFPNDFFGIKQIIAKVLPHLRVGGYFFNATKALHRFGDIGKFTEQHYSDITPEEIGFKRIDPASGRVLQKVTHLKDYHVPLQATPEILAKKYAEYEIIRGDTRRAVQAAAKRHREKREAE